ncbi:MAG: ATP-binding protein [Lacunisphaera sp.]|nr:ATP-binding protein [Lacunisphaera sp.]
MSIQLRFVVLITTVMAALLASLWLQLRWDEREIGHLQQSMTTERAILVDNLLEITGNPMNVFVTDYSPWDEMIAFVAKPEAEWARINLTDVLVTHQTDVAWVFHPDLTEVFATVVADHPELRPFPLPPAALAEIATGLTESHFFALTPDGRLLEIRGAPIRPSDLNAPVSAAGGWLFAARLWDDAFLQKLSLLADGQASLGPASESGRDKPGDLMAVTTSKKLSDWRGQPVQVLEVRHLPVALQQMRIDSKVDLLISTAFGLVALVAFYFAARYWVVRPLGVLESSLAQRSPAPLQQLRGSSQEFTRLGLLVETSLQHEQTLRQVFAAFNAIEDAVFILDTGTGRLTHVNDGAVKMLGYRHEELRGMRLGDLESEPGGSAHPLHRTTPDLRWYRCRDGRLVEVEIREQTLPTPAVAPLRVIVARDVTELKRQEQQRLQAQRLESLGNLAGGVAHDMNNMLTPITMFLEELQHADSRPSPELLASVRSSVKRGAGMLRQLLTFGRGIAGERQPLAVPRLLDEIGRIVGSTFPKSILFESRPARLVSPILGDATQLHQVLLNLCVNARDAMPNGGTLVLSADNLMVDATSRAAWPDVAPGRYVLIEVADSGTGIPPEMLEHIFEPFFTTKSAELGTGLGLSTSLGIVRSHGGFIRVESEPGQGTRFRLLLPAGDKLAAGDTTVQPGSFAGLDRTVLVVEDEENIRRLLDNTLRRLSLKVLMAAEGESGLALFKAHRNTIALVISDLHMPGMDGLTLVQAIRHEAPDLPILIMSGRVDNQTADAIATLKVSGLVDKPFGYAQIVEALGKALA